MDESFIETLDALTEALISLDKSLIHIDASLKWIADALKILLYEYKNPENRENSGISVYERMQRDLVNQEK